MADKWYPGEDARKKDASRNIFHSQKLLSSHSKCLCAISWWPKGRGKKKKALKCFTLKCSTLSVLLHVKSEELWANVKAEDFLSVLCVKKQLFCTGKLQSNVLYQCTSDIEKEGACLHTTLAKQCLEP